MKRVLQGENLIKPQLSSHYFGAFPLYTRSWLREQSTRGIHSKNVIGCYALQILLNFRKCRSKTYDTLKAKTEATNSFYAKMVRINGFTIFIWGWGCKLIFSHHPHSKSISAIYLKLLLTIKTYKMKKTIKCAVIILIMLIISCKKQNSVAPMKILIGNSYIHDTMFLDESNSKITLRNGILTYITTTTNPTTIITLYHNDSIVNRAEITSTGTDSTKVQIIGPPYGPGIITVPFSFGSSTYVGRN